MPTFDYSIERTSCSFCTHYKVCGLYDALSTAITIINDYNETAPNYDDKLFVTLAKNCKSFATKGGK